jgi:hypothetical protein
MSTDSVTRNVYLSSFLERSLRSSPLSDRGSNIPKESKILSSIKFWSPEGYSNNGEFPGYFYKYSYSMTLSAVKRGLEGDISHLRHFFAYIDDSNC